MIEPGKTYGFTLSFATPRHQEQNGIAEANWRDVRNLAFAMMNQACVPLSFFHIALVWCQQLSHNPPVKWNTTLHQQSWLLETYIWQVWNEIHECNSDTVITIPLDLDSKSALYNTELEKETQQMPRIPCCYHNTTSLIATGQAVLFKIDGLHNAANSLTKALK